MLLGKWRTVTTREWTSPSVPVAGPPEFENRFVHLTGCRPDPGTGFRGKVTGCGCGSCSVLPGIPTITRSSHEYPPIPDTMDRFTHYQSEIRKKYETVRKGPLSTYLDPPGQAGLRDLCLERCREANEADLDIYLRFMGEAYDPTRLQAARKNTERFRTISKFFKGETEKFTDKTNADMAALLVDFRPRPYWKYTVPEKEASVNAEHGPSPVGTVTATDLVDTPAVSDRSGQMDVVVRPPHLKRFLIVMALLVSGIGIWWTLAQRGTGCMQWQGDHYEKVDCGVEGSARTVLGFDEGQFAVRKVKVCDTTTFFRDGKPVLWYLKHDNTYDFFDHPGYHPEFIDRRLKPVSRYIARKKELGVRK